MKISVIIPTFNRSSLLQKAIDSIISQTYSNFEIIVVDDGSSDETFEIMSELSRTMNFITFISKETNSGPSDSRRIGFEKAKGSYVVFFDDDDELTDINFFYNASLKFKKEYSLIYAQSTIHWIEKKESKYHSLDYSGEFDSHIILEDFQTNFRKPNSTFTTLFNHENLVQCGINSMQMINDSSIFLLALKSKTKIFVMDQNVGNYNIHGTNITMNLATKFMIENLDEKLNVYNTSFLLKSKKDWFDNQFKVTLQYFIDSSKPKLNEIKEILSKYSSNVTLKTKLFILMYYIKSKL